MGATSLATASTSRRGSRASPSRAASASAAPSTTRCATGLPSHSEDMGEQQVKNIARPVHVWRFRPGAKSAALPTNAPALPDTPSIAVLPFENMTGDPDQEYFAEGMVEEIITALSRVRWLFVIARN